MSWWQFIEYQMCMPHIKLQSLQKHVLNTINSVIAHLGNEDDNMANDEVSAHNSQNICVKSVIIHLCIVDLQGVLDKERRRHKSNLNKMQ